MQGSGPCLGTVQADTDNPVHQIEINKTSLPDECCAPSCVTSAGRLVPRSEEAIFESLPEDQHQHLPHGSRLRVEG